MNELYRNRREGQFALLMKYWRLVFNDHFVIALFFIFGALAYSYAGWLPKLAGGEWWAPVVLTIWFTIIAQLGRFATLIQPADRIFLLPKSAQMKSYLDRAWRYSLLCGELIMVAGIVVAMPLALVTLKWQTSQWVTAGLAMLLGEANWFVIAYDQLNFNLALRDQQTGWLFWGESLILSAATWNPWPWVGLIVAVVLLVFNASQKSRFQFSLDWNRAVAIEQGRMDQLYRFFNLFTDVPSIHGRAVHRRWANGLINRWTMPGHPWSYLFTRAYFRDADMSGLMMRLTFVAMIVVFFIPLGWLKVVLTLLFIYLLAGEITPFFHHFDNNAMTHLLPVNNDIKVADFQHLCRQTLVVATVLIAVASLGMTFSWLWALISLCGGLILVELLVRSMPRRLKK